MAFRVFSDILDESVKWGVLYKTYHPFWETYVKGINLTVINCDLLLDKNCTIERNQNSITIIVTEKEVKNFIIINFALKIHLY